MIYWFILDNWLIGTDADALLLTTVSISIMLYNASGFLCIYWSHLLILFWNSLCELKTGFLSVKAADMLLIFGLNAIITSLGFVVLVWELVSVAQLCRTLCNPMDCSPSGFSVHGIFQARILERVVISFSRWYSRPRDLTRISCTAGRFFTIWAMRFGRKRVKNPGVH